MSQYLVGLVSSLLRILIFLFFQKNFWVSLFQPSKNFCYFHWNTVISQINLNRTNILMMLTLPNLVCYFDSLLHKRITTLWHWRHLGTGWKCRLSGHLPNQKLLVTRFPSYWLSSSGLRSAILIPFKTT